MRRLAPLLALLFLGPATAHAQKPHLYDKVIFLGLGVNKTGGFPELKFAEADVKELGQLLAARYGYTPDLLLGPNGSAAAFRDKVKAYARDLGPRDVLIVYFSGHGQRVELPGGGAAGFLLPADARLTPGDTRDIDAWKKQAIDMEWLAETAAAMKARHVLVIADSCCSGFLARKGEFVDRVDLQALTRHPSRAVLAATTENGAASEDRVKKHGIFTGHLLDALKSDDPQGVTELFHRVRQGTVKDSNENMLPQMGKLGGEGEFVFLPLAIPREDITLVVNLGADDGGKKHVLQGVLKGIRDRVGRLSTEKDVIEAFEAWDYRFSAARVELEKRWEEKFRRFEENAACGDPLAMAGLVYCYGKGLGTEPNAALAYRWARRAYDTGHPAGLHVLGKCFIDGLGVDKPNKVEGYRLITLAARAKPPFPISLNSLGHDARLRGDDREALRLFTAAAAVGVNEAAYQAVTLTLRPPEREWEPKAVEEAVKRLEAAAQAGHASSQLHLAYVQSCRPEGKDLQAAEKWLRRAADLGEPEALYELARELLPSDYSSRFDSKRWLQLPPDRVTGLRYLELSVDQGNTRAMVLLASCYQDGVAGLKPDADKARELCEKAAKLRQGKAVLLQSYWYYHGELYEKDVKKGAALARKAAEEMSCLDAYIFLGALYADGDVPKEWVMERVKGADGKVVEKPVYGHHALICWTIAASRDLPGAKEVLKEFADLLKPDDVAWQFFRLSDPDEYLIKKFQTLTGKTVPPLPPRK